MNVLNLITYNESHYCFCDKEEKNIQRKGLPTLPNSFDILRFWKGLEK